jgi:hypothetical protein
MKGCDSWGREPLFRTKYHRILQNPLYCGIIRNSGGFFRGREPPDACP